ncbi:protein MHF2 homolog [Daucus carota subsp. sativus]|uniref:protein MHF2 homolog n=1 Tax=Daucus carota subsp. sativus TaxID=79200 RepID=UPI0030826F48
MSDNFDPDLIQAIFKLIWSKNALERERNEGVDPMTDEISLLYSKHCKFKNTPRSSSFSPSRGYLPVGFLRLFKYP